MEDLFRFVMMRPAQTADVASSVSLATHTAFQANLAAARLHPSDPRGEMKKLAVAFVASANFVSDVRGVPQATGLAALERRLLERSSGEVDADVEGAAGEVRHAADFGLWKDRVFDSIIAIKLTPAAQKGPFPELCRLARLFDLAERLAAGNVEAGAEALERSLLVPGNIFPVPCPVVPDAAEPAPPPDEARRVQERIERLASAIQRLAAIDRSSYVEPPPPPAPPPPAAFVPVAPATLGTGLLSLAALPVHALVTRLLRISELSTPEPVQPVTFVPAMLVRPDIVRRLDEMVRSTLAEVNVNLEEVPIPAAVRQLEAELAREANRLAIFAEQPAASHLSYPGSQKIFVPSPAVAGKVVHPNALPAPSLPPPSPPLPPPALASVPTSHASAQHAGVGDLLVVKHHLKRYRRGEIAHIENVLKGESKEREHRKLRRSENTLVVEEEREVQEEHELETTERFELQAETQSTIKQDHKIDTGVSFSGKFGGMVEFKTNLDYNFDYSKEESSKRASKYAKDVTDRSVSKVSERTRSERTTKLVDEVEERNSHGLVNTAGPDHVVGIYQWVDKVYEAQVYNYGQRVLYDLVVPEPAAFYLRSLIGSKKYQGEEIVKPPELHIVASHLTEANYLYYARLYRANGVKPPPPRYTVLTHTVASEGAAQVGDESEDKAYVQSAQSKAIQVKIEPGYRAITAIATASGTGIIRPSQSSDPRLRRGMVLLATAGPHVLKFDSVPEMRRFGWFDQESAIGVTFAVIGLRSWAIDFEIICERTERAEQIWQIETFEAIRQGHDALLSEYRQKLSALAIEQGVQISGRNPSFNRELERGELKKGCLSLLTNQHFDLFDAIEEPGGIPQLDLAEAEPEGRYIRFFEQAFEWDQMTYVFYPYFWGRKQRWVDHIQTDDVDATFASFLKAGAARVVVPVRPGFAEAVDHFMQTGDVWSGTPGLPFVTSPLYLPIAEEIKAREGAPAGEIPQGPSWDVVLPTTLVLLRRDASLPEWEKQGEEWVEVV